MDPQCAGCLEPSHDRDRVIVVDLLASKVSLAKADHPPVPEVDGRVDVEG